MFEIGLILFVFVLFYLLIIQTHNVSNVCFYVHCVSFFDVISVIRFMRSHYLFFIIYYSLLFTICYYFKKTQQNQQLIKKPTTPGDRERSPARKRRPNGARRLPLPVRDRERCAKIDTDYIYIYILI